MFLNAHEQVDSILSDARHELYASFAKISAHAASTIWDLFGLGFSIDSTNLEHVFISNLNASKITAAMHASTLTGSMAMQLVGLSADIFVWI
jgi:hypothetical protein